MKSKVKFSIFVVIVVLALISGIDPLTRLAYALALVPALGYLWIRLNVRSLRAEVTRGAERLQVGEWLEEEITLSNAGILPKVLLEVQANADPLGLSTASIVSLPPKRSRRLKMRTKCQLRGRYDLAPITAASEDFFGLFSRKRAIGNPRTITVYPATLELPDFLSYGRGDGNRPSWYWGGQIPFNISGMRDYLPGDSLRHIHWPSTARTGKLMVRDFKPDLSEEVWIVLDLNRVVQAGTGPESTEEYGVTIAASIAKKYLEANRSVGFIAWGDQRYLFPAQRGSHNLWNLLEMLVPMKAQGVSPLAEVVSGEAERFRLNSTVVLITPSYADVATLSQPSRRQVRTIAILLDAGSFGGLPVSPQASTVRATDRMEAYLVRQGDDIASALSGRTGNQSRLGIKEGGNRVGPRAKPTTSAGN